VKQIGDESISLKKLLAEKNKKYKIEMERNQLIERRGKVFPCDL
jgi:hypothetical protein